jgi:hypothetical protein
MSFNGKYLRTEGFILAGKCRSRSGYHEFKRQIASWKPIKNRYCTQILFTLISYECCWANFIYQ